MKQKDLVRMYDHYINAICDDGTFDIKNKSRIAHYHVLYMLNRTQSMFKYSGLPDSIPARNLELQLQTNGNVCVFRHTDGNLYALTGGLGGTPNVYYMPTVYIIANPALHLSKSFDIDKDCVVVPNDSMYMGLLPLFEKYAYMLAENELSLHVANINSRLVNFFDAQDDTTKESVDKMISDIENGKISCILDRRKLDREVIAESLTNSGKTGVITDLIEYEQYLRAVWYNDLGLNANYNMKRESINSGESQLNNDALLPLIDDMLEQRRRGLEKVNAMFGTDISVSYASAWEDNVKEIDIELSERSENSEGGEDDDASVSPDQSE